MYLYLPCFADDSDAPNMFMSWYFDKDIANRVLIAKEKADDFSPFLHDVRLDADTFCIDTFPSRCVFNQDEFEFELPEDVLVTTQPPYALQTYETWESVDKMLIRFDQTCVDFEFVASNLGLGEAVRYLSTGIPYSFFENLILGNPPTIAVDHNWGECDEKE